MWLTWCLGRWDSGKKIELFGKDGILLVNLQKKCVSWSVCSLWMEVEFMDMHLKA